VKRVPKFKWGLINMRKLSRGVEDEERRRPRRETFYY
jgi:hypothetical protein